MLDSNAGARAHHASCKNARGGITKHAERCARTRFSDDRGIARGIDRERERERETVRVKERARERERECERE